MWSAKWGGGWEGTALSPPSGSGTSWNTWGAGWNGWGGLPGGGSDPGIGTVTAHPDYTLTWLQGPKWSIDDRAPLKLAITRKDGGLVVKPTGAVIKVRNAAGTLVATLPADLEPNDLTGLLCLPAQVQFVAALYTFPAAGRYSIEAIVTLGADGQHRASTAQIVVV